MRAKSLILLVVALGCGMIAAVAASKAVLDKGPSTAAEATVEIFVAVKDLPTAHKITADYIKLDRWPKSRVPEGALVKLEQLEDQFTNQVIFAGEPILDRKLSKSRESFSTHIPKGYRIFDIPGSGGYIKPGDHVDILGTFSLGGRNSAPESRTVMRNVKVHGINGISTRDSDEISKAKSTVFQLLVKESQLEALTLANKMGELRLNLRPFGEGNEDGPDTDNGESFLSWISESQTQDEPAEEIVTTPISIESYMRPAADEPKNEMMIITPNGVTRYQWTGSGDMPKRVDELEQQSKSGQTSELPANAWGNSNGTNYSGYGGYTPTYPTSTAAPQPTDATPAPPPAGNGTESSVFN